jgi:hypothetical protein
MPKSENEGPTYRAMREASKPQLCHCGKLLHYSDNAIRRDVESLIRQLGERVTVTLPDGRSWLVPRHYIALHGECDECADTSLSG